uniref:Insulin receptor substrate 2 n=1 Tax=Geotrypetes seraphini TaxID=260995 RepID=A0A6P8R5N7_GEOSA|nr:insulin receptor substrate 2 [Geotrypetes seraphini]
MASPSTTGLPLLPLSPPGGSANLNHNNNNNSSSVKKCGYLRKHKHGHKRFFVLREPGDGYPARLEYYESEKKWKNKAAAAKRVIALDACLNINKRADAKHKHLIALYTKDEYFAVAADNEQEQESWYQALTDLLSGNCGSNCSLPAGGCLAATPCSSSAASSCSLPAGADDLNYGLITPASATYREVWQVTLKPKGLGQSKNLTGVYRLCLSARTIGFVKLNSEVPSVTLQLMNIRRCGHSDSFFFIEVGRSAATGPGELWMQADDSVVAQNIHETILEAMKAMKELAEFRPRSKSQSSGSNPITVPSSRRHHHLSHPPPSQTGLPRRSRNDTTTISTSPASKFISCRNRTASEGDGRATPAASSPLSPGTLRTTQLSRSNTMGGRHGKIMLVPLPHSRSMSMPMSQSPPPASSPVSLSSSSGHGSASDPLPRPFSCSASVSPSDGGFLSLDEYGSSPGPQSATPESSAAETPPLPGRELYGYMIMERQIPLPLRSCRIIPREDEAEKGHRKRTYSLTTPARQRVPAQVSSTSLDEATLGRLSSYAASPKLAYHPYPEDYGDVEIGSSSGGDDGYMPMTPGVAPSAGNGSVISRGEDYMPMSPTSVSAPKLILHPRPCTHLPQQQQPPPLNGYKSASPAGSSPEDNGYVRMWCGSKLSVESSNGDYMNMCPNDHCASLTPPDYFSEPPKPSPTCLYTQVLVPRNGDSDQYVFMNSLGQRIATEVPHQPVPSPDAASFQRARAPRPSRLPLDTIRTLPSMSEQPLPPEPDSPGEYINIDFGQGSLRYSPPSLFADSPVSSVGSGPGRHQFPLSDYMNLDFGSQSPKGSLEATSPAPDHSFLQVVAPGPVESDYTEMTFGASATPPQPIVQKPDGSQVTSPTSGIKRMTLIDQLSSGAEVFTLPGPPPPDPNRGAKVIRVDPQGRRRHSSETFSSTTTVTPVSPSFAHNPKRHNSASVENVSLRKSEGPDTVEEQQQPPKLLTSPMCRHTSAGFQNGLNHIAMDESLITKGRPAFDLGAYTRMDFATAVKE